MDAMSYGTLAQFIEQSPLLAHGASSPLQRSGWRCGGELREHKPRVYRAVLACMATSSTLLLYDGSAYAWELRSAQAQGEGSGRVTGDMRNERNRRRDMGVMERARRQPTCKHTPFCVRKDVIHGDRVGLGQDDG